MVKNSIKIYARLKQENQAKTATYEIFKTENTETITFHCGHVGSFTNNKPHIHKLRTYFEAKSTNSFLRNYRFEQVFDQKSKQTEVFDTIAKPVVNSVIEGFNGTIFAYGQTGSGKTYAITGSSKDYQERGIIPRSIEEVFDFINKAADKYTIYISYLELYNEVGYDLLNPKSQISHLEELPKVILLEDGKGESHIRNLTVQRVSSEQEAMRLLFIGDNNRTITETPMNVYSSRSHCIFTIFINSRNTNSGKIRRSKLNLVDLAGSERICKSNIRVSGTSLNEAKYINLSLHYLEQVILSLSQKKAHIPFRNSMLTYVLKDSLSGNCKTVLLATLSVNKKNIEETIATCKFAQRVAEVNMESIINDEIDPQQEIDCLKTEIESLRRQLVQQSKFKISGNLTKEEKQQWKNVVNNYLDDTKDEIPLNDFDLRLIKYSFELLKDAVKSREEQKLKLKSTENDNEELIEQYKVVIKQKEDEIITLKNLLGTNMKSQPICSTSFLCSESEGSTLNSSLEQEKENIPPHSDSITLSPGQKVAFEVFMKDSKNTSELDYYTQAIQDMFDIAKKLTLVVEQCQNNILAVRAKHRPNSNQAISEDMDLELQNQQSRYRISLQKLHELKTKTEKLTNGLENAKLKVLNRFQQWYNNISSGDNPLEGNKNKISKNNDKIGALSRLGGDNRKSGASKFEEKLFKDASFIKKKESTIRSKIPPNSPSPKFEKELFKDVDNSCINKKESTSRPKSPPNSSICKLQNIRRLGDNNPRNRSAKSCSEEEDVSDDCRSEASRPRTPSKIPRLNKKHKYICKEGIDKLCTKVKNVLEENIIPFGSTNCKLGNQNIKNDNSFPESTDQLYTIVKNVLEENMKSKCLFGSTNCKLDNQNIKNDNSLSESTGQLYTIVKNVLEETSRSKSLFGSTNCKVENQNPNSSNSSCDAFAKVCPREEEKKNEITGNCNDAENGTITSPNSETNKTKELSVNNGDNSKIAGSYEENSKSLLTTSRSSTNNASKVKELPKKDDDNACSLSKDCLIPEEKEQSLVDYTNYTGRARCPHRRKNHKSTEKNNPHRTETDNSLDNYRKNPFINILKGPHKPEHLKHDSSLDYSSKPSSPKTVPSDSRRFDTFYQFIMGYDNSINKKVEQITPQRPCSADSQKTHYYTYNKDYPKHRIGVSPVRSANNNLRYTDYYIEDSTRISGIPELSNENIEEEDTVESFWQEQPILNDRERKTSYQGLNFESNANILGLRRSISPRRERQSNKKSVNFATTSGQREADYQHLYPRSSSRPNSPGHVHRIRTDEDTRSSVKVCNSRLFSSQDSSVFRNFISTIPLTGDSDVDEEIVKFYRTKFV